MSEQTTHVYEVDWANRYDQRPVKDDPAAEEELESHFELDFREDPVAQLAFGGARHVLRNRQEAEGQMIPVQRFPQVETGADLLG